MTYIPFEQFKEIVKKGIDGRFSSNPFAIKWRETNAAKEEARKREHAVPEVLKRS